MTLLSSCIVGGNKSWNSHFGEQYGDSLKKLEVKPPYDPTIPLLGIYTKENKVEKDTCTQCSLQLYLQ